jgi:hypothetical protein
MPKYSEKMGGNQEVGQLDNNFIFSIAMNEGVRISL